jgi:hypothetical protein
MDGVNRTILQEVNSLQAQERLMFLHMFHPSRLQLLEVAVVAVRILVVEVVEAVLYMELLALHQVAL